MRLSGTLRKDGRWWLVDLPILDAGTQGRTRREALQMAADLVESMVGADDFKVAVHLGRSGTLEISTSDTKRLIALVLKRQRQKSGLSLAQAAERLGAASRNGYARYEQGRATPSVDKLDQLLLAVGAGRDFVLRESTEP